MSKITSKNTKDQILEAYNAAQEEIKRLKEGKTTTAEVVKAKEIKEIKEKATDIINLDILNDDMKDKYTALLKTVDLLEKEIEELYSIKKEADTLEALINAGKDKSRELEAEHEAQVERINSDLAEKKADNIKKVTELKAEYTKLAIELEADFKEKRAKVEKERTREQEEFEYNLKRERQKENDAWEDEKTARELILKNREEAITLREAKANENELKIIELEDHIAKLNDRMDEVKEASFKEGKDKAAKEYAIQKNMIEKESKWAKERLEERIANLEKELFNEKEAHRITSAKLDEAYVQIREIATKTVEASGSVRIVDSSKN